MSSAPFSATGWPTELLPRSVTIGAAMGACAIAAVAIVRFAPLLTGDLEAC